MALEYYKGTFCLGKDCKGKWWPICITGYNSGSTVSYTADVMDGHGTTWKACYPENLKPDFPDMEGKSANGKWYPVDVEYDVASGSYSATSYQEGHGAVNWPKVYASNLRRIPFVAGKLYEGLDSAGAWWPIMLKKQNADQTWVCDVFDGVKRLTWDKAYECNIKGSERTTKLEGKSANGKWYPIDLKYSNGSYSATSYQSAHGAVSWPKVYPENIRRLKEDNVQVQTIESEKKTEVEKGKDPTLALRKAIAEEVAKLRRVLETAKSRVSTTKTVLNGANSVYKNANKVSSAMKAVQQACSVVKVVPGIGSIVSRVGAIMKAPVSVMSNGTAKAKQLSQKCDKAVALLKKIEGKLKTAIAGLKKAENNIKKDWLDELYKIRRQIEDGVAAMNRINAFLSPLSQATQRLRSAANALAPIGNAFKQVKAGYDNSIGTVKKVPLFGWLVSAVETVASGANFVIDKILSGLGINRLLENLSRSLNPLQPLFEKISRMVGQMDTPLKSLASMDAGLSKLS